VMGRAGYVNQIIGPYPEVPRQFELKQNRPNPFNPATRILYTVPESRSGLPSQVTLSIYSLSGRLIARLVQGPHDSGYYQTLWRGWDDSGTPVSSGTYLLLMQTNQRYRQIRKMTLLK